ncbi:hypothetical protein E3T55_01965 [Cryobacterium frigoriphilum]|uniref:Uncharacterized protein n=1 Tax=Cryobacterium frigoriphilum TaxID=1259150 RepID=A0A4R9AB08_9MICO|nr:hypothetical protein [Cryobacterium frigoriphilum]TFD55204.1 hypothetical protein E3T55_01965 [Cryobacterium frigoriphilum]
MRREQGPDGASGGGVRFGVGVQVIVRLDRTRFPDSLAEDPVGVIVAPGELTGAAFYAPTTRREAIWQVEFEEPFYGLDGSGPHDSAVVPQGLLEAAPSSDQPES